MWTSVWLLLASTLHQTYALNGTLTLGSTNDALVSTGVTKSATTGAQTTDSTQLPRGMNFTADSDSSRFSSDFSKTQVDSSPSTSLDITDPVLSEIATATSHTVTNKGSLQQSSDIMPERRTTKAVTRSTTPLNASQSSAWAQLPVHATNTSRSLDLTSHTVNETDQDQTTSIGRSDMNESTSTSSTSHLPTIAISETSRKDHNSASQAHSGQSFTLAPSITAALNGSDIIIGSTTLAPGDSLISGTISVSLASSGIIKIDDSTTSLLPAPTEGPMTASTSAAASEGPTTATSTMTTLPGSVSMITRTDITRNTWMTTSQSGSETSTIVPVIWCPSCGATGAGILILNLPPTPRIQFSWPELPNFEIPCIPLPFKPCSTPPKTDEGSKMNEDDEPEEEEDDDEEPITTSETVSSTTSESCTTTTASACTVACSAFITSDDENTVTSTTKCYTTNCVKTVGCSATSVVSTSVTSIESTPGPSCAFDTATNYNAKASYQAMGLPIPAWLGQPLQPVKSTPFAGSPVTDADGSTTDASATSTSGSATDTPTTAAPSASTTSTVVTTSNRGSATISGTPSGSDATLMEHSTRNYTSTGRSTLSTISGRAEASSKGSALTSSKTSNKSSISSTKTSSTASKTPTLAVGEAVCRDRADFPNHGAVQPDLVHDKIANFCEDNLDEMMNADSTPVRSQSEDAGVSYDYVVEWITDCDIGGNDQSIKLPKGLPALNQDCTSMFIKAFACNNGGIGGYVDVGCLRYTFTGGEFTTADSPSSDESDETGPEHQEPEPTPVEIEPKNLQCHSLQDYSKKTDVSRGTLIKLAGYACGTRRSLDIYSKPSVYTFWEQQEVTKFLESKWANYLFTYEWIPDCISSTSLDIWHPAGEDTDYTCESLFAQTYDDCRDNKGIGGSLDVGCLRYSFHGGLSDEATNELYMRGGSTNGIAIGK